MASEPRVATVEGVPTLIVTQDFGLPPKLGDLIRALTQVTFRTDITPKGARKACEVERTHRFTPIRRGRWWARTGLRAGEILDLRVSMCADCGAVEVRDTSLDVAISGERVPAGRGGPQRRSHVIGWYSGARRNHREYR